MTGVVCAAIACTAATTASAQETLYGSTADSSGGSIVILDAETAGYTTVGDPLDDGPTPAIAMNAAGELFVSNNDRSNPSEKVGVLRRIDPATGAVLATIGVITDSADAEPLRITSMEFDPVSGRLFGVSARGPKEASIFTIDTSTAAATLVGATGLKRGGLAFAPDGRLFLATADPPDGFQEPVIARIDPASGAVVGTPVELSLGREIEGLVVRPSDGVMFANYADGSSLFTIDPDTGEQVEIGRYNGSEGHVADMTYRPVPAMAPTRGLLLPERVKVKVNAGTPEKSGLKASARIDACCGAIDLDGDVALHVNGTSWDLAGGKLNGKGTRLVVSEDGLKVVLRTGLGGTSRGALSVKLKDDLTGIVAPGGDVTLRLVIGDFDASGTATLEDTRFDLRRGHAVDGPPLVPLSIRGRSRDPGRSSVKARLGLPSIPAMPATAPDVLVEIGSFSRQLAGADGSIRGDRIDWSAAGPGLRKLRVDYGKREISFSISDADLGHDAGPLSVRVRIGGDDQTVEFTPRTKGSSFRY